MPAVANRKNLDTAPKRKTKGHATDFDVSIGGRVRVRRSLLNMSQEKLAEALGITFQQVQKYEKGQNRISASRLNDLSRILNVPIQYFFDELPARSYMRGGSDSDQEGFGAEDIMDQKETYELIRTYYSISDPKIRKNLLKIIKATAENLLKD